MNSRFCSKAAHLGLSTSVFDVEAGAKDDLESVCYILIHIYTKGEFLRNVAAEDYHISKGCLDFSKF